MFVMDIFSKINTVFGSQAALADALKLNSCRVVSNWKMRGSIPAKYYRAIVEASNGQIEYEDLIPK